MYYLQNWVYYINIAMLTTCQVTWCTIIFWITTCKIGCTRKTIFLEYLLTVWCHLLKKNVWTSDKSWEPGSFLMFSYVFQCFLTFSNVTYSHSHSHSLSLSHSLTLSHSHTLSISHWITLDMLNNFCFHLYPQNSLSHSITLSLSLSHSFNLSFTHSWHAEQLANLPTCTLALSHSLSLDMLNKFCFHVYGLGSKVAVYSRKMQWFFWTTTSSSPSPVTLDVIELVPS